MKITKLIFWVLVFLAASIAARAQEICFPEKTVDEIILTIRDYESLKIRYNSLDSTLTVWGGELKEREEIILKDKVTIDQYKQIVSDLNLKITNRNDTLYEAKKQIRKLRISHVVRTVVEIAVIVLIIAI